MKVKLTPLNIVSAICLVLAAWVLMDKRPPAYNNYINISSILIGFYLLTAVVAFISDLIFRKFIPSLKKLWIVEGVLMVFIIILIFIIKVNIS